MYFAKYRIHFLGKQYRKRSFYDIGGIVPLTHSKCHLYYSVQVGCAGGIRSPSQYQ